SASWSSCLNDHATTETYTLSLHDALPISPTPEGVGEGTAGRRKESGGRGQWSRTRRPPARGWSREGTHCPLPDGEAVGSLPPLRSEEHTSELQSRENLVCRLLL